jgi:hypothetical protein
VIVTARHGLIAGFVAMIGIGAAAQQPEPRLLPPAQLPGAPPPPQAPPPPANPPAQGQKPALPPAQAKPAPEPPRQPINVRIEVTISDETGKAPAMKKTVTAVSGDGRPARVRTQVDFQGPGDTLNLDVTPTILIPSGRIQAAMGLEYTLPAMGDPPAGAPRQTVTRIQENLWVNLEDGKPLIVSQSADPVTDRQVTVEIKRRF